VTAGNCCRSTTAPRGRGDERRQGRRARLTPLARIVSSGLTALSPEIMGWDGGGFAPGPDQGRNAIEDIDLVEINEAFAAQSSLLPRSRVDIAKLNVNAGLSRGPPSHDRRAHHDDLAERPAVPRRHAGLETCAWAAARAWR